MKNTFVCIALSMGLSLAQFGCGSRIEDLKSQSTSSTVPVTESSDGIVTGLVDTTRDAKIAASGSGALADSSILIPAGALQIDGASVSIDVGPAVDQTQEVATAMGFSAQAIADGTAPLFVSGSDAPVAVKENELIQLSMPLPIKAEDLKLQLHSGGHLALLYVVYTGSGYKAGIKTLSEADLRGIFIETKVSGLGFFRVIYLGVHVEDKEVQVNFSPSIKRGTLN